MFNFETQNVILSKNDWYCYRKTDFDCIKCFKEKMYTHHLQFGVVVMQLHTLNFETITTDLSILLLLTH